MAQLGAGASYRKEWLIFNKNRPFAWDGRQNQNLKSMEITLAYLGKL